MLMFVRRFDSKIRAKHLIPEKVKIKILHFLKRLFDKVANESINAINEKSISLIAEMNEKSISLITEKLKDFQKPLMKFQDISLGNKPINQYYSPCAANDLFTSWKEIEYRFSAWKECDLILACPITIQGARLFFPQSNLVSIGDPQQLIAFFNEAQGKMYKSVGIISPFLLSYLNNNSIFFFQILQICRYHFVILSRESENLREADLRRLLHYLGFYEVGIIKEQNKMDFHTICIGADGSFNFQASKPGIVRDHEWKTYIASRFATPQISSPSWDGIIGCFWLTEGKKYKPGANEFALAITKEPILNLMNKELIIRATATWTKYGPGYASLISCYQGPGDQHMYAGSIELKEDHSILVSILRNDGEWLCLASTNIRAEIYMKTLDGSFELPFWLKITASSIIFGIKDEVILTVQDTQLPRIATAGIRSFNDTIALTDITIDYLDEVVSDA